MGKHVCVTEVERRIFTTLAKFIESGHANPVKAAAKELQIAEQTVYTTRSRLKRRYAESLDFGKDFRSLRRRLGAENL